MGSQLSTKGAQEPPPRFQPMSIVATIAHLSYCCALVTVENTDTVPSCQMEFPNMENFVITAPDIRKLLANLDGSKSTGPDELPPRVLKEISFEVAPLLTFFFNQCLQNGQFLPTGAMVIFFHFTRKVLKALLPITGPYPSPVFAAK